MHSRRNVRCLACGESIVIDYGDASGEIDRVEVSVSIGHPNPIDASCRWMIEAMRDELQREARMLVQHTVDQIHKQIDAARMHDGR